MTENAVHGSPTEGLHTQAASFGERHWRGFATAAVIGVLMTLVGALQTGELPIAMRLVYWETLMLSGALIGLGVSEGVQAWGRLRSRKWIEIPFTALLIALPLTLMVVGTSVIFFGIAAPAFAPLAIMFGITLFISLVMTMLNYMIAPTVPVAPNDLAPALVIAQDGAPNRFVDRLPLAMRGNRVIALQAEDHYLRVHLDNGQSTLILMRLSDAIAELHSIEGAQTHRSWWVAKSAVKSAAKSDGRATLVLNGDLEAPVSRSYYRSLGDAGWLA